MLVYQHEYARIRLAFVKIFELVFLVYPRKHIPEMIPVVKYISSVDIRRGLYGRAELSIFLRYHVVRMLEKS